MSGLLVIAEQRRGELRPVSLELIGAAQSLRRDGDSVAVALLAPSPGSQRSLDGLLSICKKRGFSP